LFQDLPDHLHHGGAEVGTVDHPQLRGEGRLGVDRRRGDLAFEQAHFVGDARSNIIVGGLEPKLGVTADLGQELQVEALGK
jgi:hypothetical protein